MDKRKGSRKPRHYLELIADLTDDVRQAQGRVDVVIIESLALGTPWRDVARAAGVPMSTLRRRFSVRTGPQRPRWSYRTTG